MIYFTDEAQMGSLSFLLSSGGRPSGSSASSSTDASGDFKDDCVSESDFQYSLSPTNGLMHQPSKDELLTNWQAALCQPKEERVRSPVAYVPPSTPPKPPKKRYLQRSLETPPNDTAQVRNYENI